MWAIAILLAIQMYLLIKIYDELTDLNQTMQSWYETYVRKPEWEDYLMENPDLPERQKTTPVSKN